MSEQTPTAPARREPKDRPVRILRVVARLIGGPAYHVALLGGELDSERFETLLVHGSGGRHEDTLDEVIERYDVHREVIDELGPELRPDRDARALVDLVRIVRRYRPDIVHTHTAKAGMLGRTAARIAGRSRPVVVHTYHGHVLEGYFGPVANRTFLAAERGLARITDQLVGVSDATVSDLVRLGVAPRERFAVVPVGLDLERFAAGQASAGAAVRREIGVADDDVVVVFAGRLVPIKRVDLLLSALARARRLDPRIKLVVVGSGDLKATLQRHAAQLGVAEAVHFLGHRTDVDAILAASDVAVLSSDNEGTPVFLIEAAAARVPAVATDVGGVGGVIGPDMGLVVPKGQAAAIGDALVRLAADPELRARMGAQAQAKVLAQFSAQRLVRDVTDLYERLLEGRDAIPRQAGAV